MCFIPRPSVWQAQECLRDRYGGARLVSDTHLKCQGLPAKRLLREVTAKVQRGPVPVTADALVWGNKGHVNPPLPRHHISKAAGVNLCFDGPRCFCHPYLGDKTHVVYL